MRNRFRRPSSEDYETTGRAAYPPAITNAANAFLSWLLVAAMLLGWAASCASCFGSNQSANQPILEPRPASQDDAFEIRIHAQLTEMGAMLSNAPDSVLLWMIDDDDINAASFGNGRFLAWRGLRQLSEDDLQAVLAHEMAHDALMHSQRTGQMKDVTDFLGEVVGVVSGADLQATSTLKTWGSNLVLPKYSRDQELQADSLAVVFLSRLGYPDAPNTMCGALLAVSSGSEGSPDFFASHPATDVRRARIASLFPGANEPVNCFQ